jgi:FtsH-binding integral membrane protein
MITHRKVVEAGVGVLAAVTFAAWIASLADMPKPIWVSNPFAFVLYPAVMGARFAWEQRSRGSVRIVAAGVGGFASMLAVIVGFDVLVTALHPWARDQAWLGTAMLVAVVVGAVALVTRHIVVQTNPHRRRVALAQAAVVGMIVIGLWLGTRWWEATSGFGLLLALIGTFAVYFLDKERMRDADQAEASLESAGS